MLTPPRSTYALLRGAVANTRGAIDLASIMVGVLVIGVIASIISASVFGVIPWSQDQAAKETLSSVAVAESAIQVYDGSYSAYDSAATSSFRALETSAKPGLQAPSNRTIIDVKGGHWLAATASDTGVVFYRSSTDPTTRAAGEGVQSVPAGFEGSDLDRMVTAIDNGTAYDFSRPGVAIDRIPGFG